MDILITGAKGFAGRNLAENLKCIRDGKDRRYPGLEIGEIFEYDVDSTQAQLEEYCAKADFVFNFAGVNRPKDESEFFSGNVGFADTLLQALRKAGSRAPVMLASSAQASLIGRYEGSVYGRSKLEGEKLFFDYAEENGSEVLVYRFTNLFGKWCRPNYNSAVSTFCHNYANDLPVTVTDPAIVLELTYIDDLVDEMVAALLGKAHRCDYDGLDPIEKSGGKYAFVPVTHKVSLGEIIEILDSFKAQPSTLVMPEIPAGSFRKKLYSAYLSYLPEEKISFPLKMNKDDRGSFTELLKTLSCGQFSVNVSRPGITKGQHWHNTKWEFFIVVSGEALIQMRRLGSDKTVEFRVSGEEMRAVHMLPGYTHNIINLSDTKDLVTLMWANELFDPSRPDTFFEPV